MAKKIAPKILFYFFTCLKLTLLSLLCSLYTMVQASDNNQNTSYLFMLEATKGQVVETANHQQQLILHPIHDFIYYFSERPKREAGPLSMNIFIKMWETNNLNSFKNDHPNAVIARLSFPLHTPNNKDNDQFIILSKPSYNESTHTLTFNIEGIKRKLVPETIGQCALFIDSYNIGVNGNTI